MKVVVGQLGRRKALSVEYGGEQLMISRWCNTKIVVGLIATDRQEAFLHKADQRFVITCFQIGVRIIAEPVIPEHIHSVRGPKGRDSAWLTVVKPAVKLVFCCKLKF